jgi:hypothetical protein
LAQKADPGSMAQAGYSAGSRRKGSFDWVQNLKKASLPDCRKADLNIKLSAIFALFWQSLKNCPLKDLALPIKDLEEWMKKTNIFHMDAASPMHSSSGPVTIDLDGDELTCYGVEFAPPCGIAAVNYAKYFFFYK